MNKRIVTISDMDPNDLVREVGVHAATGVMLSQSLPDPNSKSRPMVAEYARLVESAGGRIAKNAYTLEGYIQARVIVEGLRRAAGGSASSLMDALETLKNFDLGDYFISFSPSSHEGALFVDTAIISSTGRVIR